MPCINQCQQTYIHVWSCSSRYKKAQTQVQSLGARCVEGNIYLALHRTSHSNGKRSNIFSYHLCKHNTTLLPTQPAVLHALLVRLCQRAFHTRWEYFPGHIHCDLFLMLKLTHSSQEEGWSGLTACWRKAPGHLLQAFKSVHLRALRIRIAYPSHHSS